MAGPYIDISRHRGILTVSMFHRQHPTISLVHSRKQQLRKLDVWHSVGPANSHSEPDQPQFKLDIRSEPIREEGGDPNSALSSVANTLRAVSRYGSLFCLFPSWFGGKSTYS